MPYPPSDRDGVNEWVEELTLKKPRARKKDTHRYQMMLYHMENSRVRGLQLFHVNQVIETRGIQPKDSKLFRIKCSIQIA